MGEDGVNLPVTVTPPLPPLTTFNLPHQTHELNTGDMNASKLEKVGIQLNHVANSPDMTASFLCGSLVTTELNQTLPFRTGISRKEKKKKLWDVGK